MSNLMGMDAGEVRMLAGCLRTQANSLQSVVSRIDAVVHQMTQSWQGSDATEFVGGWQQQHRVALLNAHQSLAGLAQSADNNAAQQDHASGTSGSGSGSPSLIAGGGMGGAAVAAGGAVAAGTAAAASSSGARLAAVNRFVGANPIGSTVGSGQCVSLFEEYSTKYVHTPGIYVGPYGDGACDLYTRFDDVPGLKENYTQLPASTVPQPGDVAVWDASSPGSGGYGHVAIVTGTTGSTVHIIQQNWVPDKVSDGSFSVGEPHLLGYLRPKVLS